MTVDGSALYVGTGRDIVYSESKSTKVGGQIIVRPSSGRRSRAKVGIFHSADLGTSWTNITPTDESGVMDIIDAGIQILAVDKTLFVLGVTEFRSRDGGKTWTRLRANMSSRMVPSFPAIAIDANTFYKGGKFGISRTTDAGESWHPFVKGMTGPRIYDFIALNQRLYMNIGRDLVYSTD